MANPFTTGGPIAPEQLVGRVRDLDALFEVTAGHIAVHGSSGMGKSSLLRALTSQKDWELRGRNFTKAVILYLNCQDLQPFTPARFWREILELAKAKRGDDRVLAKSIDKHLKETPSAQSHVLQLARDLERQGLSLLLLLDDYDAVVTVNDSYTEAEMMTHLFEFRKIANDPELRNYATVVATSRRLNEMGPSPDKLPSGSPWYNQYTFRPLKPFVDTEIDALLGRMPSKYTVTIKLKDAIREIAGGNPALLQCACKLLFEEWEAGNQPTPAQFSKEFESRSRQYFQNAWRFSSPKEQMCLMLIALSKLGGRLSGKRTYDLGDLGTYLSQRGRELNDLIDRGLISLDSNGESHSFTSSIMEWWVVQEIESCNQEEIESRHKIMLGLMSRKQAERLKSVIKQVWEQKETIKSIIGYAGKLVGAFGKGVVAPGG